MFNDIWLKKKYAAHSYMASNAEQIQLFGN